MGARSGDERVALKSVIQKSERRPKASPAEPLSIVYWVRCRLGYSVRSSNTPTAGTRASPPPSVQRFLRARSTALKRPKLLLLLPTSRRTTPWLSNSWPTKARRILLLLPAATTIISTSSNSPVAPFLRAPTTPIISPPPPTTNSSFCPMICIRKHRTWLRIRASRAKSCAWATIIIAHACQLAAPSCFLPPRLRRSYEAQQQFRPEAPPIPPKTPIPPHVWSGRRLLLHVRPQDDAWSDFQNEQACIRRDFEVRCCCRRKIWGTKRTWHCSGLARPRAYQWGCSLKLVTLLS